MFNIIKKTRYKIFYVSPNKIKFCISPSKHSDYNQFNSDLNHPHAGQNRGVFKENLSGFIRINNKNWDIKPGIFFSKLLEYRALKEHYNGKQNWKKSLFAQRYIEYIKIKKVSDRGLNIHNFLVGREKQIDSLFKSVQKKGVYPSHNFKNRNLFIDNISVALTKKEQIYFNNRGHHRLSIAKILGLKKIPIKITVAKSKKVLKEFVDKSIFA
tara:strand:+ start:11849 stop:12484 length:636 start_codon:yes stop_codon:yes gene_type:complete